MYTRVPAAESISHSQLVMSDVQLTNGQRTNVEKFSASPPGNALPSRLRLARRESREGHRLPMAFAYGATVLPGSTREAEPRSSAFPAGLDEGFV